MEAIVVLASEEGFLIRKKIEELKEKYKSYEVTSYDMKSASLEEVIEDLDTYHFLVEHKMIIASNCTFLTSESQKEENIDFSILEKYLNNPNPENILVLCCSKLDERKKIVKKVLSVATRPTLEVNIKSLIKSHLEDFQMKEEVITYLVDYCRGQNEKILSELEKLKLYCHDQKEITKEDIKLNVTRTIDDDIFHLVDAIVTKNKKEAIEIYEELLSHNEEPIKILILVANQFRLLYQVKVRRAEYRREEDLAKALGIHPYRVKLALQKANAFQEKELLHYLEQLSKLDEDIKLGNTFQDVAFELFILTI